MTEVMKNKIQLSQKIGILIDRFFKTIILLVIILVLAAGYFLVIGDQYGKLQKSRKVDLAQVQNTLTRLKTENAYMIKNVDKNIDFSPAEERLLSLALPDQFDLPSLIIQLGSLSNRYGFTVVSVDVKESGGVAKAKTGVKLTAQAVTPAENDSSQLRKVNVNLAVAGGNYDRFKDFIKAMEGSVMIFDILSINFKADDIDAQKYTLNFATYYFRDKANN